MWFSIEHEVPGRVRVRLSGRIAARDVHPLATVVMSAPGARDVRIYPRTGSVAVSYEPVGDAHSNVLAYLRGIDEYRWGMLPEEKHAYVEGLRAEGHHVLMVGDGVNDSPALACADVGVAMAGGTAIAREVADITLSSGGLWSLVELRKLSQGLMRRFDSTFVRIMVLNSLLLALGIGGVITPQLSSLVHNASTTAFGMAAARRYLPA